MRAEEMPGNMTDGFHLVVEALKLNGVDTIYGVAGIPITDLLRLAQAEGIRYFGFKADLAAMAASGDFQIVSPDDIRPRPDGGDGQDHPLAHFEQSPSACKRGWARGIRRGPGR